VQNARRQALPLLVMRDGVSRPRPPRRQHRQRVNKKI
jgi:hypothetical protein